MGKVKIILIKNITIEITNTEKEIYDVIQNSIKITEEKISLICDQIYQTKNFAEILGKKVAKIEETIKRFIKRKLENNKKEP